MNTSRGLELAKQAGLLSLDGPSLEEFQGALEGLADLVVMEDPPQEDDPDPEEVARDAQIEERIDRRFRGA